MAHFAKIDENNFVINVVTLNDSDMLDSENNPSETVGQNYLQTHNNWPSNLWIQTSYNTKEGKHLLGGTPFRGNYAVVGGTWDSVNNIFLPEKPYSSWVKNTTEARWQSPIGDPPTLTDEQLTAASYYAWDESNQNWVLTTV
tara:strand:+ start:524 stop:949 length:426 start_codon:yes stop_codon:yes gene_type:complete